MSSIIVADVNKIVNELCNEEIKRVIFENKHETFVLLSLNKRPFK